ncbi:MAG TPA: hypothetical protein VFQ68_42665 [Streptosporangiaceae bacterium]|nr:hypothetical protein [Streptosporangiaceae bacterium]
MQQDIALTCCAIIARHWFEIDLDDASMEHGARIELQGLVPQQYCGSESPAQLVTADRSLWRADLPTASATGPAVAASPTSTPSSRAMSRTPGPGMRC